MKGLEFSVGIDLYINETTAHCDYVLPATTMYERDDFPLPFQLLQPTPFRQATEAVVAPAGQAREEWAIIDELSRRLADRTPALRALQFTRKALGLFGIRLTPRLVADAVIRLGAGGDRFGLNRGGLTFRRLTQQHPHGVVLAPNLKAGVLPTVVVYRGAKMRLVHDEIAAEIAALGRHTDPDGLSAAPDRHARVAVGELLDAQRAAADAGRPDADRADACRRRRRPETQRRRPGAGQLAARRDRTPDRPDQGHRRRRHRRSRTAGDTAARAAGAPPTARAAPTSTS